jgi:hypothetical protein
MKKTLFTAVLSIVIIVANAQVNKGSILLGGNISANTSNSNYGTTEAKQNSWVINPSVGYAYKLNRIIGFSFGYSHGNARTESGSTVSINRFNNYSAGIYQRSYFPIGKNFSLYGQGDLSFGYLRRNVTNTPGSSYIEKQTGVVLSVSPGISYAISKKIMIELGFSNLLTVGYNSTTTNYTGTFPNPTNKTNSFSIGANANPSNGFNFGFRFLLGNK